MLFQFIIKILFRKDVESMAVIYGSDLCNPYY